MLNHSFSHIPSVGLNTEKRIWESGVKTMDDFLACPPEFMTANKCEKIVSHIKSSKEKICCHDALYFCSTLPSKEQWRIYRQFQDKTAYLDIETTGFGGPRDIITTIALYDGKDIYHFVNGQNLDQFKDVVKNYQVLVTYNGKTFDVPFIQNYLKIKIPHAHLDLRYILNSLGYSGGLKSCEHQMGIGRQGALSDIDGYFAVLLWKDYVKTNDEKVLHTLLSYNIEDVINLEYLMIKAYNQKLDQLPFDLPQMTIPKAPQNPFEVDEATVERIRGKHSF